MNKGTLNTFRAAALFTFPLAIAQVIGWAAIPDYLDGIMSGICLSYLVLSISEAADKVKRETKNRG